MQKFCMQRGDKLKRVGGGGGLQLQVASGGALEDNVKKLVW